MLKTVIKCFLFFSFSQKYFFHSIIALIFSWGLYIFFKQQTFFQLCMHVNISRRKRKKLGRKTKQKKRQKLYFYCCFYYHFSSLAFFLAFKNSNRKKYYFKRSTKKIRRKNFYRAWFCILCIFFFAMCFNLLVVKVSFFS